MCILQYDDDVLLRAQFVRLSVQFLGVAYIYDDNCETVKLEEKQRAAQYQ